MTATEIHPLADPEKKFFFARFVHPDGKEYTFTSVVNSMTGDRLSYLDRGTPTIDNDGSAAKSIIKQIKEFCEIKEMFGSYK